MATVKRRIKKKHTCSCGRTFAHAISLKRHRFVSGCEEVAQEAAAEAPEPTPEPEPVTVAPPINTALTVQQIAALQELANSRLQPIPPKPSVATKLWNFTVDFTVWLAQESRHLGIWAAPHLKAGTRRLFSLVTWIAALTIFVGGVHTGLTMKQAWAEQNQPVARASDAAQTITDFYRAINGRAYDAAYKQLSTDWKRQLTVQRFRDGYVRAKQVDCHLLEIQELAENVTRVDVQLVVDDGSALQTITGHYTLVLEHGSWKLDNSELSLQ